MMLAHPNEMQYHAPFNMYMKGLMEYSWYERLKTTKRQDGIITFPFQNTFQFSKIKP